MIDKNVDKYDIYLQLFVVRVNQSGGVGTIFIDLKGSKGKSLRVILINLNREGECNFFKNQRKNQLF